MTSLYAQFSRSAHTFPERVAIEVDGESILYRQLEASAQRVAATLQARRPPGDSIVPLTCVLGQRSAGVYAGILGSLASGHGYVPMLTSSPTGRIVGMLDQLAAVELLVDSEGLKKLEAILAAVRRPMTVILLDADIDPGMRQRWPTHRILGHQDLAAAAAWQTPKANPGDLAYVLFTSGSTGQPKGVMVSHANVTAFLDVVVDRYSLVPEDRFSHMFDLTFDLSVFDMFAAWSVGACLCCPGARDRLLPSRYINESNLSVWFSVPSALQLMKKTGTLVTDAFPKLRISLFCGESLIVELARAWIASAPRSHVENIYGPTELTLACTGHPCDETLDSLPPEATVPIGTAFPGMSVRIIDDDNKEVADGQIGELWMSGPQCALGYWENPERTAESFVVPAGQEQRFYRTGDRVRRSEPQSVLEFHGRSDQQIKLRGYRVELGEIEAALRRASGANVAIAVPWPLSPSGSAEGIVAFVTPTGIDAATLRTAIAAALPSYMTPREIRFLERFPLNANGKVDRKALAASLG